MSIERWEIDSSHSGIEFVVRHLLISKVRGRFSRWSGAIEVPDDDWACATVNVVVDASSIDTGIAARDAHLRTPEYLDIERFPEIMFRSRLVTPAVDGRRRMVGTLSIKGHTGEVTLHVEEPRSIRDRWGNDRAAFSARATLDRREFGITGNLALDSGVVIGRRIAVELDVVAVRQRAAGEAWRRSLRYPGGAVVTAGG